MNPYDFTPLRQHIANVLFDHANGGGDGVDDAVQAIFDHPDFPKMEWQPMATAPQDGTPFAVMVRSLATYAVMDPIIGRFRDGTLEWNRSGQWEAVGYPPVLWAAIPATIR